MNIFRILGDLMHVASIIILLAKMYMQKSCAGISLKSQELYLLVFVTRYLDLFTHKWTLYLATMKILFISTSGLSVYWIRTRYWKSYSIHHDRFRHVIIIAIAFVLALLFHHSWGIIEILWTFSLWLEALAILPQIIFFSRVSNQEEAIDALAADYVFVYGGYRALYIANWIWRWFMEPRYSKHSHWVVWCAGILQTTLFSDYAYRFMKAVWNGDRLKLPS